MFSQSLFLPIPSTEYEGSYFSVVSPTLSINSLFNFSSFVGYISVILNEIEYFFLNLLAAWISSFLLLLLLSSLHYWFIWVMYSMSAFFSCWTFCSFPSVFRRFFLFCFVFNMLGINALLERYIYFPDFHPLNVTF